jgi:hypothetical protein
MGKTTIINKPETNNNQIIGSNVGERIISMEEEQNSAVFDSLLAEGGENFFHYISWLGLGKDPNLMILSSIHHYYYDFNELKGVRTLINLKPLNQINHIDNFLNNVYRVLPQKANFVGCFKDNKMHSGLAMPFYQSFRFLNSLINIIDAKSERFMSRKDVAKRLESHAFSLIDMTEISKVTYFCAQNHKKQ